MYFPRSSLSLILVGESKNQMTNSSETMLDIREEENNKHLSQLEKDLGINCESGMYPITCKFTDCKGDGFVHHGGEVDTCEACQHYSEEFDIGN